MQTYLRDKRGWMNRIVVAHMQFFCCVLSVTFIGYGWIPLISALCSTALFTSATASLRQHLMVIAALCLTLSGALPLTFTRPSPAIRRSASAYHTGRHWTRRARFRAPLILGWVGASPSPCRPHSRSSTTGTTCPPASSSPDARRALRIHLHRLLVPRRLRRMRELRSEEFKRTRPPPLEYEQEQERRLVAQDERTRIAREMPRYCGALALSIISPGGLGATMPPRAPAPHAPSKHNRHSRRSNRTGRAAGSGSAANRILPSRPSSSSQTPPATPSPRCVPPRATPHGRGNRLRTRAHPQRLPALVEQSRRAGVTRHFHRNHRHHGTHSAAGRRTRGVPHRAGRRHQRAQALPGAATTVTIHGARTVCTCRFRTTRLSTAAQHIARPVPGSGNGPRYDERIALTTAPSPTVCSLTAAGSLRAVLPTADLPPVPLTLVILGLKPCTLLHHRSLDQTI